MYNYDICNASKQKYMCTTVKWICLPCGTSMLKICLQTGIGKQKYLNINELKGYLDFPEHAMMFHILSASNAPPLPHYVLRTRFQNPAPLSPAQGSLHSPPPRGSLSFPSRCHCTRYILLWQRPPCCVVIVRICISDTELAGVASCEQL